MIGEGKPGGWGRRWVDCDCRSPRVATLGYPGLSVFICGSNSPAPLGERPLNGAMLAHHDFVLSPPFEVSTFQPPPSLSTRPLVAALHFVPPCLLLCDLCASAVNLLKKALGIWHLAFGKTTATVARASDVLNRGHSLRILTKLFPLGELSSRFWRAELQKNLPGARLCSRSTLYERSCCSMNTTSMSSRQKSGGAATVARAN